MAEEDDRRKRALRAARAVTLGVGMALAATGCSTSHTGGDGSTPDGGDAMKARVRDNGSQWTGWKEFLTHLSHRLSKGDGKHTLEVQV